MKALYVSCKMDTNLMNLRNFYLTKCSYRRSESRQRSSDPLQMKNRDKATMPGLKLLRMLERRTSFIFMRFTTIYDYWINSTPIRQDGHKQHCPITAWTVKLCHFCGAVKWSKILRRYHRGLSTLAKYHIEAMGLQIFFSSFRYTFMHYFLYKIGLCFAFFHLKCAETF